MEIRLHKRREVSLVTVWSVWKLTFIFASSFFANQSSSCRRRRDIYRSKYHSVLTRSTQTLATGNLVASTRPSSVMFDRGRNRSSGGTSRPIRPSAASADALSSPDQQQHSIASNRASTRRTAIDSSGPTDTTHGNNSRSSSRARPPARRRGQSPPISGTGSGGASGTFSRDIASNSTTSRLEASSHNSIIRRDQGSGSARGRRPSSNRSSWLSSVESSSRYFYRTYTNSAEERSEELLAAQANQSGGGGGIADAITAAQINQRTGRRQEHRRRNQQQQQQQQQNTPMSSANRSNQSFLTGTDGDPWSSGTGSSVEESESLVSWNEEEHGSLPSQHQRARQQQQQQSRGGIGGGYYNAAYGVNSSNNAAARHSARPEQQQQQQHGNTATPMARNRSNDTNNRTLLLSQLGVDLSGAGSSPEDRAQRLMAEAQEGVRVRRSGQEARLFGTTATATTTAAPAAAGTVDRLNQIGENYSNDSQSAYYEDEDDDDDGSSVITDLDRQSRAGQGARDRVGISRPNYGNDTNTGALHAHFGEEDSRERSYETFSEHCSDNSNDEHEEEASTSSSSISSSDLAPPMAIYGPRDAERTCDHTISSIQEMTVTESSYRDDAGSLRRSFKGVNRRRQPLDGVEEDGTREAKKGDGQRRDGVGIVAMHEKLQPYNSPSDKVSGRPPRTPARYSIGGLSGDGISTTPSAARTAAHANYRNAETDRPYVESSKHLGSDPIVQSTLHSTSLGGVGEGSNRQISYGSEGSQSELDAGLRQRLGLGTLASDESKAKGVEEGEKEKEYDPFDLGSATTNNSGAAPEVKTPRWHQQQQLQEEDESSPLSQLSSSSGSYSTSESSFPASFVVAKPHWERGSIADSSIKSVTANLRATVQEEAIKASSTKPERLPVYKRVFGRRNKDTSNMPTEQGVPRIQEERKPTLAPSNPNLRRTSSRAPKKLPDSGIQDPFDLGSSSSEADEGGRQQGPQSQHHTSSSSSGDSGSSSSSGGGSYTTGSSSEDTPPARVVVTKDDWAAGSVAESSLKSITAHLQVNTATSTSVPEKLPAYGGNLTNSGGDGDSDNAEEESLLLGWSRNQASVDKSSPSISRIPARGSSIRKNINISGSDSASKDVKSASEPSLDPLYVTWGAEEGESSSEGEENYQAWPDHPERKRKVLHKDNEDVDSIEKGWVIICINNIISPEKASAQENRAKGHDDSWQSSSSLSLSSESDAVIKELFKREEDHPNIVLEGQETVKNLSAMWEVKTSRQSIVPKEDAGVVQSRARVETFRLRRQSAITLQSVWRSYGARKRWAECIDSAITIQVAVRTMLDRLRLAAMSVQRFWRCVLARRMLCRRRQASVTLQSFVRGASERQRFHRYLDLVRGCVALQALARGRRAREQALMRREDERLRYESAAVFQNCWRMHRDRDTYLRKQQAACVIQSHVRGHQVRQAHLHTLRSCVFLQAMARGAIARSRWKKEHHAAETIQAWWRRVLAGTRQEEEEHVAACIVEAAWRTHVERQRYKRQKALLIHIQAFVRGGLQRNRYRQHQSLLWGVISFQSIARGNEQRKVLSMQSDAAICIQRHYRCHKLNEATMQQNEIAAVRLIQAHVRCWIVCRHYHRMRSSCIVIQSKARGLAQKQKYRSVVQGCVMVQALSRRRRVQQKFNVQRDAALTIQRSVRSHHKLLAEKKTKGCAATILQRSYRSTAAKKSYERQRAASIAIQSAYRGSMQRLRYGRCLSAMKAAIILQSTYRGIRQRSMVREETEAARKVQGAWRNYISTHRLQEQSAVVIANAWRLHVARHSYKQAIKSVMVIQAMARGWVEKERCTRYFAFVRGCIMLQALARGAAQRRRLNTTNHAARIIQQSWQARKYRLNREEEGKRSDAATTLQSSYRCFSASRTYRHQQSSSITIQSAYRMSANRRRYTNYVLLTKGMIRLQSIVRANAARRKYELCKSSAIHLQSAFRASRERSLYLRYIVLVRACIRFQGLARGALARKQLDDEHRAARSIQGAWRQYHVERKGESIQQRNNEVESAGVALGLCALTLESEEQPSIPQDDDLGLESAPKVDESTTRTHAEELVLCNSIDVSSSRVSSSNLSRYLNLRDASIETEVDIESSSGCHSGTGRPTPEIFGSYYDEDRIRQALAMGACSQSPSSHSSLAEPSKDDAAARHPRDGDVEMISRDEASSPENNEFLGEHLFLSEHSFDREGTKDIENASIESSRLSDYFDDDLPPASNKTPNRGHAPFSAFSSTHTANEGAKSDAHPSSNSTSSESSHLVRHAPTSLAPVAEESVGSSDYSTEYDLEANNGRSMSMQSLRAAPDVDERRMDCVAPSSWAAVSSIRAQTEDLVRQTLLESSDAMGPSSNLSSCFREENSAVPERAVMTDSSENSEEDWESGANATGQSCTLEVDIGSGSVCDSGTGRPTPEIFGSNYDEYRIRQALAIGTSSQTTSSHTSPAERMKDDAAARGLCDKELEVISRDEASPTENNVLSEDAFERESTSDIKSASKSIESSRLSYYFDDELPPASNKESYVANEGANSEEDWESSINATGQSSLQHKDKETSIKLHPPAPRLRSIADSDFPGVEEETYSFIANDYSVSEAGAAAERRSILDEDSLRQDRTHAEGARMPASVQLSDMEEGFAGEDVSLFFESDASKADGSLRAAVQRPDNAGPPPAPMQMTTMQSSHNQEASNRRKWIYVGCSILLVALLATVITLATVNVGKDSTSNSVAGFDTRLDTAAPTSSPTSLGLVSSPTTNQPIAPVAPTVPGPSMDVPVVPTIPVPSTDAEKYVAFVDLLDPVSGPRAIQNPTSPQHKATKWIVEDDSIAVDSPFAVQRYVLAVLYFSTKGEAWSRCGAALSSEQKDTSPCPNEQERYLSRETECRWYGVSCNENGMITGIALDNNRLDGELPAELGSLTQLERLVLPRNELISTMPSSFGSLESLQELDLFSNKMSGRLPTELGRLPLYSLQLSTNRFTGSLAPIFNPELVRLDVSVNELVGPLPEELFAASSLQELNVGSNNLSGTLSESFEDLTNVRKLLLWLNDFTGTLPSSLGALKRLEVLHTTYNSLSGSVPSEVCDLYDNRLKKLSTDCAPPRPGQPAKVKCSCCTLCLEGYEG